MMDARIKSGHDRNAPQERHEVEIVDYHGG
jgi:hypothetical protein